MALTEFKVRTYLMVDKNSKNMTIQQIQNYGEKIARSFFLTNTYLKYRNENSGTFVVEYKDITAYVVKELERYTNTEYCSDEYMKEVYEVRKYVTKHFQKLLEDNTQYYAEFNNVDDCTVLIINEKK